MIDLYERLKGLSPRQRQVAWLLAQGYTEREIASKLGVTRRTVRVYKDRIKQRLRFP